VPEVALKELVKDHLFNAVATAAVLGGGATIIQNRVTLAQHDTRIERIEKLDESMEKLADELAVTRETLARVEARQEKTR
jgi:hypothetical protein